MTARFERAWSRASRANLAASTGFLMARPVSRNASGALATPVHAGRRPACAGQIPNVKSLPSDGGPE